MDYEDLENYTLMNMLEDDEVEERADNIHLDNKFTLVNHNVPHTMEDDEKKGFSVFCEQTIKTCADMSGVSLDNLSSTDLMCIADDISSQVLKVMNDCKIHLMMTKQKKLTCNTLGAILKQNYGFRCYGEEVFQFHDNEKNEGYSIQKQCEKQFDLLGNSKIKNRLFINNDFKLNCMDGDKINFNHAPLFISMDIKKTTYNSAQFHITQKWINPSEEYTRNLYAHIDKKYFCSILDILLSDLNIPFLNLVNDFDINRVALKLIHCTHMVLKVFLGNETMINRLFDFFLAFANSQQLWSPAYTLICLNLLKLSVAISTKEFVCKDQPLPLCYSTRRKTASLVADMVKHWGVGSSFIKSETQRVNKSLKDYKELLSHSGAVHSLAALGRDLFKHLVFFRITELFSHIKKFTSRIQGAQKDRRLVQRFYQDWFYVRDALFQAIYALYKNNFLETTSHLHRQSCLDGDILASQYLGDLALLIRHNHHNTPSSSCPLYLDNSHLIINVNDYDEEGNEIKTETNKSSAPWKRKRDKDTNDLNALIHINVSHTSRSKFMAYNVTHVPRTKNYNCFDNEIIGPILNQFSKVVNLNYKERQLFVDDIYYRCMHSLAQARALSSSLPPTNLQAETSRKPRRSFNLSTLRKTLYTSYPSGFLKPYHTTNDVYSVFQDYRPVKKNYKPYSRIRFKITYIPGVNCMQKPEYKLKRMSSQNITHYDRSLYYQEYDPTHMAKYRHEIFCGRKKKKKWEAVPK
uniref:Uncharacterized protein n=1 Tax=Cacopsylla melanoneura TaxID=428564 RepID=A0A8D8U4B0_9HEMI